MNRRPVLFSLIALGCCTLLAVLALHPGGLSAGSSKFVTAKSYPITLTNLRNTVTNFGSFGTRFGALEPLPGPSKTFPGGRRTAPLSSCEWPAGSRNNYLNDGEIWVGALSDGDTAVTTGRLSGQEWVPLEEIGKRTGSTAFSNQDTYTRYDDGSVGPVTSPLHVPLGIQISQLTFAWTGSDHIVHALQVKNTGPGDLDSVYIGFCWDFNVSTDAADGGAPGDMVGLDELPAISYMFDADGDGGRSPGYIGGKFLYRPLAGHSWWSSSQDPESDAQRYALMAGGLMSDPTTADDYRVMQSIGPFDLPAGRSIPVLHILAIGDSLTGLQGAVSDAKSSLGESLTDEGDSTLADGPEHVIEVTLDESKRALAQVQFAVDWEFCNLDLYLVNPDGRIIYPMTALTDPRINYTSGPHHKSFIIADPRTGGWEMHISYLSGPPSFPYHHSVTLFDVPYDQGLPLDYFQVDYAYIHFGGGPQTESCYLDSFEISGDFELREGASFDPDHDPVFVRMGPYTETIPEGSFEACTEKYGCYEYFGSPPGIVYMLLELYEEEKGTWDCFEIYGGQVDMSGAELLTLVRLAVGQNTSFEGILLEDHGDEWWYYGDGGEKTRAKTSASTDPLPAEFSLSQNYPNPFNATTQIAYHLPRRADIHLALYNVSGQRIAVLVDQELAAGTYLALWDGRDSAGNPVASGIYFCQLRAGTSIQTRKMILMR